MAQTRLEETMRAVHAALCLLGESTAGSVRDEGIPWGSDSVARSSATNPNPCSACSCLSGSVSHNPFPLARHTHLPPLAPSMGHP